MSESCVETTRNLDHKPVDCTITEAVYIDYFDLYSKRLFTHEYEVHSNFYPTEISVETVDFFTMKCKTFKATEELVSTLVYVITSKVPNK